MFIVFVLLFAPPGVAPALLVMCDMVGWQRVVPLFDRERLITGSR